MPLAFLILGILLIVTGVKNTQGTLGKQIASDFSGAGSFWYWTIAVIAVGLLGYAPQARDVSRLFLALIILVFMLSNNGFWAQLQKAIASPSASASNDNATQTNLDTGLSTINSIASFLNSANSAATGAGKAVNAGANSVVTGIGNAATGTTDPAGMGLGE